MTMILFDNIDSTFKFICKVNEDIFKKGDIYSWSLLSDEPRISLYNINTLCGLFIFSYNKNYNFNNKIRHKYIWDYFYTQEELRNKKLITILHI